MEKIYVSTSDGARRKYVGMDMETVALLLSDMALTYSLATKEDYIIASNLGAKNVANH